MSEPYKTVDEVFELACETFERAMTAAREGNELKFHTAKMMHAELTRIHNEMRETARG